MSEFWYKMDATEFTPMMNHILTDLSEYDRFVEHVKTAITPFNKDSYVIEIRTRRMAEFEDTEVWSTSDFAKQG